MTSRRSWIIIGVIIAVIAAAVLYLALARPAMGPSEPMTTTENSPPPAETPIPNNVSPTPGAYTTYSESGVAETSNRKVLFFHASWCPQCRAIETDITNLGVPAGYTIFKVDYDTATDLKKRYGVTLQTTIVEVDSQGTQLKKLVAYNNPSLDAVIKGLNQ